MRGASREQATPDATGFAGHGRSLADARNECVLACGSGAQVSAADIARAEASTGLFTAALIGQLTRAAHLRSRPGHDVLGELAQLAPEKGGADGPLNSR